MELVNPIKMDQDELLAELDIANWEVESLKIVVREQAQLLRLDQTCDPHTPGLSTENQMERIKELALALRDSERDLQLARQEILELKAQLNTRVA